MNRRWDRAGLAVRLLGALTLVVLVALVTAWLVALAVAPGVFALHMRRAGADGTVGMADHVEQAFASANAISLAVALVGALIVSVVVSLYLARRLNRALRPLSGAAAAVAAGRFDLRVAPPGLGPEFDHVVQAFNEMALRLHRVEDTRRRLLADLAHELRTPVATLDAYLEAIEDGVAAPEGETLTVMHAQTARLARLAEDVAAVSQAEEQQLSMHQRRVPAADLAVAARDGAAERYAAKGVALHCEISSELPPVMVDPDRLAQVFANLLDNALRATPVGGQVTIRVVHGAGQVAYLVADTGIGIAADHLPHVFERFYRADAARDRGHGGSGIGLAIVRALVEGHGGRATVASPGLGQGTTFTVTLPQAVS